MQTTEAYDLGLGGSLDDRIRPEPLTSAESPLPTMEAPTAPMGGISSSSSRRPAARRRRCSPAAAPLTAAALALAAALAGAPSARAFPAYDNPILAAPALVRPGALLCQVEFITNAACDGYEKVVTQPFAPPGNNPECRGWVSKVVLDFHGAVKGVQFDRFGGLFLGDVELLRTTTPEPSPQGITWHVEKDVSDYMTYILDPLRPKTAILSIPNVIDGTYTGVLYVNATLSFYGRKPATSTASSIATLEAAADTDTATDPYSSIGITKNLRGPGSSGNMGSGANMGDGPPTLDGTRALVPEDGARPPLVLPLAAPSMPMMKLLRLNKSGGGSSFWASMAVSGNDTIEVPLPAWPQPNIARVHLDLFASPHQCEEFFYTNVPSDQADRFDAACGGGTYRELQVYVNGQLAGAVYPFLVLYTGGVNPFLWRPLSGIESFDIPAYRFDLTPFAGLFNTLGPAAADGASSRPHVTLRVFGNNQDGLWYLTSSLLLYPDPAVDPDVTLRGELAEHSDTGVKAEVEVTEAGAGGRNATTTFKTVGYHTYALTGSLVYPSGAAVTTTVSAHLSSWNENTLLGGDTQHTRGGLVDHVTVEQHDERSGARLGQATRRNNYPYVVNSYYGQDGKTMELRATVDVAMERKYEAEGPYAGGFPYFAASWANRIRSQATYNRSVTDHDQVNKMFDDTTETFEVVSSAQAPGSPPCYDRRLVALDGRISEDSNPVSVCVFPPGLTFCGYQLCEAFGKPPTSAAGAVTAPVRPPPPSPVPVPDEAAPGKLEAAELGMEGVVEESTISRVSIDAEAGAAFVAVRGPMVGRDAVLLAVK